MSDVIPLAYPQLAFDFKHEARTAALNEACASAGVMVECVPTKLCPECEALANQIESRLIRAFIAGQASMQPVGD